MALTSRSTLMARIAPIIGGYAGSIASGGATTAVLTGLVGAFPDDELNDAALLMPDAATAADQIRVITDWTGLTGTATFGTRADTTYTSETYIVLPKGTYTVLELRDTIDKALRDTRRTLRMIIPTARDRRRYPLAAVTWLRNARDVDGVQLRASPNLIDNEDFARWHNGTTSAPDGWTLAGSGATIARGATFPSYGAYTAQVTRVANDATLTQDVPYYLAKQLIDDLATVAIKVRCTATVASRVRVGINNGVSTTYSSYHSGDGEPEDLTASLTLTAAASRVQIVLSVDTGDTMGDFDMAVLVEDSAVPDALWFAGSESMFERDLTYNIENAGSGVPVLVLACEQSRRQQLVIVSRRPYATLATDGATTEAPADLIEAKTIYELSAMMKPGQDRARPDRLMQQYGQKYRRLASGLIDKPIARTYTAGRVGPAEWATARSGDCLTKACPSRRRPIPTSVRSSWRRGTT